MKIVANLGEGRLSLPDKVFPISNLIRTVRGGTRSAFDVVRSIPDNMPFDPQPFPKGLWKVTSVEWQKERGFDPNTYGPVKIRTDAWQMVNVWELDGEGDYFRETDQQVPDHCYWLHYSVSKTTLGCIRLASEADAVAIAKVIAHALDWEEVLLEVV
jgi:hypothetical protein